MIRVVPSLGPMIKFLVHKCVMCMEKVTQLVPCLKRLSLVIIHCYIAYSLTGHYYERYPNWLRSIEMTFTNLVLFK
jgi:hypothetical protein